MLVAEILERLIRELRLLALDFLQAQNVRLVADDELLHDRHAQSYRVDIPGGQGKCHGEPRLSVEV
ncbi:hypothetical protein D3C87_2042980 [compost metagenome]